MKIRRNVGREVFAAPSVVVQFPSHGKVVVVVVFFVVLVGGLLVFGLVVVFLVVVFVVLGLLVGLGLLVFRGAFGVTFPISPVSFSIPEKSWSISFSNINAWHGINVK